MVFITAGMGGGTGTGAAPVIARMARERNILTVGVVTKPFAFEGSRRARIAELGIEELQQFVDTLIVIPNQNLFRLANERTGWKEAFKMADNVLYMGVRGVTDLMVSPGLVNLDFADIRTVMAEMGKAMMGTGEADGENRAIRAAEAAISNPLLEDTSMAGARGLLINITGGEDMTLFEVDQAANRIREEVEEDANIIFGSAIDEGMEGKIRVSVVATGIDCQALAGAQRPHLVAVGAGSDEAARGGHDGARPTTAAGQFSPGATARNAAPAAAAKGMRPFTRSGLGNPAPALQPVGTGPRPLAESAEERSLARNVAALVAERPLAGRSPQPVTTPAEEPARQPHRGLFAPASRPMPSLEPSVERAESAVAPAARGANLFGIVTGVMRRALPAGTAPAELPAGRGVAVAQEAPEHAHASVRVAAGEEMGLDIPAFLRRQSS